MNYLIIFINCLALFLMLISVIIGPGIFNRILAINCFGTFTIVFFAILSTIAKEESYIDIALIYGLINFVATIAFLKYFREKIKAEDAND